MFFNIIDISSTTLSFFKENSQLSFKKTNALLKDKTGIVDFFEKEEDFVQLKEMLEINQNIVSENRVEYGDFQTNKQLAEKGILFCLQLKLLIPCNRFLALKFKKNIFGI